jgi:hypothetical protein
MAAFILHAIFRMDTRHPRIYAHSDRWAAMAALQLAVARGWLFFISGELPPERAQPLAEKFQSRFGGLYGLSWTRNQADTRKKQGLPRPRLILAQEKDERVRWWLLCDRPELPRERLENAREKGSRITWGRYELVRVTKPRRIGGGQNWTWRYRREVYATHVADGLRFAAHESPRMAQQLIDYLSTDPGFSGLRTQRMQLFSRMVRKREREKPGRIPLEKPGLPVYQTVGKPRR